MPRNEKIRDENLEEPDGRKQHGRSKGKAAEREQPREDLPGWKKARAESAKRDAQARSDVGESKDELKARPHRKMGTTVGGVKPGKRVGDTFDHTKTSIYYRHSRPRSNGGFSSSSTRTPSRG